MRRRQSGRYPPGQGPDSWRPFRADPSPGVSREQFEATQEICWIVPVHFRSCIEEQRAWIGPISIACCWSGDRAACRWSHDRQELSVASRPSAPPWRPTRPWPARPATGLILYRRTAGRRVRVRNIALAWSAWWGWIPNASAAATTSRIPVPLPVASPSSSSRRQKRPAIDFCSTRSWKARILLPTVHGN